jgi:hypothetical protein
LQKINLSTKTWFTQSIKHYIVCRICMNITDIENIF